MLYTALKHSHILFAVLTLLLSIAYVFMAWQLKPQGKSTLVYVFTRIFGGIAALTGLGVTFVGPWQHMAYPYVGLILYVIHGLCIGFAKRSTHPAGSRRFLLVFQFLLLMGLTGLMGAKPF